MQNSELSTRINSLYVPDLTCGFVHTKQCAYLQNYWTPMVLDLIYGFVQTKQRA